MSNTVVRIRRFISFTRIHKRRGILTLLVMMVILLGLSYIIVNKDKGEAVFKRPNLKSQPTSGKRIPGACPDSIKRVPSLSKPPHYPSQGTGMFVNVSATFDTSKFNRFCETSPPLTAILPAYSAVDNFNRRTAIRDTIGRECQMLNCKVMFIIGYSQISLLMQRLRIEYENYQDILIVDHVDTYRDLNNKAVAMLDWLLDFCTGPKYVIHFLDDAYIDIHHYLEDLETVGLAVYGYVLRNFTTKVIHYESVKFQVSPKDYPYWKIPDFSVGNTYAFPNTITKTLRCAVPKAIYIWIEDMWLMGHVRQLAGIRAVSTKRKVRCWPNGRLDYDRVRDYLFMHPVSVDDFYRLYYSKIQKQHLRIQ